MEAYRGAIGGLPRSLSTWLLEAGSLNPEFALLASQANQLVPDIPISAFPELNVQAAVATWHLKGCGDPNTEL